MEGDGCNKAFKLLRQKHAKRAYIPDSTTAEPYLWHNLDAILVQLFANVKSGECVCDGKEDGHVGEVTAGAQPTHTTSMRSELKKLAVRTFFRIRTRPR